MKKRLFSALLAITFMFYIIAGVRVKVEAATTSGVEVNIRIEGVKSTIAEGKAKGSNLQDCLINLLKSKNIPYDIDTTSGWLKSINGIANPDYGKNFYWGYIYKNSKTLNELVPEAMNKYVPGNNDSFVFYYADYTTTYIANTITFTPHINGNNKSFAAKFVYKDYSGKLNPIVNAIVTIDNKYNYVTDKNGQIKIQQNLSAGEHLYNISGYSVNKSPVVVMDKGIIKISKSYVPSLEYNPDKVSQLEKNKVSKNISYELSYVKSYIAKHKDDPWASLTLAKYGIKGGDSFIKEMAKSIKTDGIGECSNTDLEKLILNLVALGYSPYSFDGKDLVKELFSRDQKTFLINDSIFALLVYSYGNIDGSYSLSKDKLIDLILSKSISYKSGSSDVYGWAFPGDKVNPDLTGAALSALAPYNDDKHPKVEAAIQKAVNTLSLLETKAGFIADSYGVSSESLDFVINGLTAVGENPEGSKFTKLYGDLVSALISFKGTSGEYKHSHNASNDYIATEQAFRAFYSLNQYKKSGKYNFYENNINAKRLPTYKI